MVLLTFTKKKTQKKQDSGLKCYGRRAVVEIPAVFCVAFRLQGGSHNYGVPPVELIHHFSRLCEALVQSRAEQSRCAGLLQS